VKEKPTESVSQTISLDHQDRYGMTALHHAVIRADMDVIKGLIENGAGINTQDNYGWTPLHWAVFKQDEIICRLLVQIGASTTVTSTQSWFKFPAGITAVEMAKMTKNKAEKNKQIISKLKKMETKIIHRLHRFAQIIKRKEIRVNLCTLWTNKTHKEKIVKKINLFIDISDNIYYNIRGESTSDRR
jgi:ankyrin repeat protein